MVDFLHLLALSGYLGAWAALLRAFREGGGDLEAIGWKVGLGAATVHAVALAAFLLEHRTLPLIGLGPASSTLAMAIALLTLGASIREDVRPTTLFVLPMVMALLAEAVLVGVVPTPHQTEFQGPWFWLHVTVSFVGYAGLALSSSAAAMYVLQFRSLKRKQFGSIFRFFPALDTLDRVNRTGLEIGFTALTLGLLAGWSWTLSYGRGLALDDPQVVFGIITWTAYLAAIVARLVPGGRGSRSAVASTIAFVVTAGAFGVLRAVTGGGGFFL